MIVSSIVAAMSVDKVVILPLLGTPRTAEVCDWKADDPTAHAESATIACDNLIIL
jgi:hypothetical protein